MADNYVHPCNRRRVLTIDDLPDDDLLAIFDFYVIEYRDLVCSAFDGYHTKMKIESWQLLVHVCRRWRGLVFSSPRRLNLQLYYPSKTPERVALDVWPALPLLIFADAYGGKSVDYAIAGLEYSDRIRQISVECNTTSQIINLWTAMQVPFPKLEVLRLTGVSYDSYTPVLPDSLLGGSAPRLRLLALTSFSFPGLPKLLLSATQLVNLSLCEILHSGYISPEAMATCLSMLTSLETLRLEFESPPFSPDLKSRRPFPPTRSVLPTLTNFRFVGVSEYLEEFVARIDAPQLFRLSITFFDDVDFNTPELNQFIGHTRTLTLGEYDEARIAFGRYEAQVKLCQSHPPSQQSDYRMVGIKLSIQEPNQQLSTLTKICNLSLHLLLTTENLYIYVDLYSPLFRNLNNVIDNTKWRDLLRPFTAVKNLYLSKPFPLPIVLALKELTGERTTEVLPTLQNILLGGFQLSEPVPEGIFAFISARQLTNHPVAVSVWEE